MEMNQNNLQEKVIELNVLDSRLKEIQQQIQVIDQQLMELQILEKNIDELKKVKKNSETLSSLGPGVFIKSRIENNEEIFIDIGSKIIAKKTAEEAKELVKKRTEQIMNIRDIVVNEINNIVFQIQRIESEIQQMTGARQ